MGVQKEDKWRLTTYNIPPLSTLYSLPFTLCPLPKGWALIDMFLAV